MSEAAAPPADRAGSAPLEPSLRPFDVVLAWYFVVVAALIVVFAGDIPGAGSWFVVHAGGAAAALLFPLAARRLPRSSALVARFALAYGLVVVAFHALGGLVEFVSPDDREWHAIAADRRFFGVDATRAAGAFAHPLLTEVLQLVYASFYFLPIVLAVALARSRDWRGFEIALTATTLGFLLSYLGYFLGPVRGPEYFLPHEGELEGLLFAAPLRAWIARAEPLHRDCFPSGHTAIAIVVAAMAWRFHRRAFAILGPLAFLLVVSTVYLRYHYAVDVVAGIALAVATLGLNRILVRPIDR